MFRSSLATGDVLMASTLATSSLVSRVFQQRLGANRVLSTQPVSTSLTARKAITRVKLGLCAMSSSAIDFDKSTPEDKWREVLGTEEYRILRQKGTEAPGSGEYNKFYEDGTYRCGGCGTPLYTSETKFDSGCGWPAFYAEIPGTIDRHVDSTFGMRRVEITCKKCGGHLGHVFENEGFPTPKNNGVQERHCVNSKSLKWSSGK